MAHEVHYNFGKREVFNLIPSQDLFLIRTRNDYNPQVLIDATPSLKPLWSQVRQIEHYPEASVFVYRIVAEDPAAFRDELKAALRKLNDSRIIYTGTVMQFKDSGIYQIYTGNLFLKFEDDMQTPAINAFLKQQKLIPSLKLGFAANAYFVKPQQDLQKEIFALDKHLLNSPGVQLCHPELVVKRKNVFDEVKRSLTPINGQENDWIFDKIGLKEAWQYSQGEQVKICIIDNGLDFNHPAFSMPGKIPAYRDMLDNGSGRKPQHQFNEKHGTACAGIACSSYARAPGIAPKAQLMPVRTLGLGSVLESEAFYWAAQHGADIISCSWGPPDGDFRHTEERKVVFPIPDHTNLAIRYAARQGRQGKGCLIFFAAGNGNEKVLQDEYASHPDVMAIGAINKDNKKAVYGDYDSPLFCSFPSGDYRRQGEQWSQDYGVLVTDRLDRGYGNEDVYPLFSGTSASCPGVAGIAALALALAPDISAAKLKKVLQDSCLPLGGASPKKLYHPHFGYGLLRADWVVQNIFKEKLTKPNIMSQTNSNAVSLHIGINNVSNDYYASNVPPLFACVKDMETMTTFARELGYETHQLRNQEATRDNIKNHIRDLGNKLEDGDILMITYAGHGAQLKDQGSHDSEEDGYDESWVTYDGFLLDDEIFNTLAEIRPSIRVLLISDSCHSQTMSRNATLTNGDVLEQQAVRERHIGLRQVTQILALHNETPGSLRKKYAPQTRSDYRVYVKNLSACLADETAKEENSGGYFTNTLISEFRNLNKGTTVNYEQLIENVKKRLIGIQEPNISNSHRLSPDFDGQFPFDVARLMATNGTPNGSANGSSNGKAVVEEAKQIISETPISQEEEKRVKLFFETEELYVETRDSKAKQGRQVKEESISNRSVAGFTAWDKAYQFLLNRPDSVGFVEPETLSRLYFTDVKTSQDRSTGSYLDTYPNPEQFQNPTPFIWHLDDEHSQLRKANEKVFPAINTGAEIEQREDVVKIAHIDTGYLPDHPSLPGNIDRKNAKSFDWGNNNAIDNDDPLAAGEQQGHGQGTISILAGNWVDLEHTDNNYKGFFGAIPNARVLPIKVGETVALISGKRFARAVDYAIEQGCEVITMSMAGLPSKVMAKAVNRAYEAGVVIVSAASNSFSKGAGVTLPKRTLYPARYDRVIAAVGAAYNKKPYLNKYHVDTRAAGGRYMQTCYGPESVLPTSIAAYTPNISWFNKMENNPDGSISYYVKSGGGTSSATPQIAAAAALYIQHYRKELKDYEGSWKKAEIVRQALFHSADASTAYNYVYGNGLLRAFEALDPQYSPDNLKDQVRRAKPAPEKRRFLGGLFGVWRNRSLGTDLSEDAIESLQDMMATEINQLLHKDPALFPWLDKLDLDDEEFPLDDPDMVQKILDSEYSSDFLRQQLLSRESAGQENIRAQSAEINNRYLESVKGNLVVRARGLEVDIVNKQSYKSTVENHSVWVDEFELDVRHSRSLRSGAKRELTIEVDDDKMDSMMLVEKVYESGAICSWKSDILDELAHGRERSATTSGRQVYIFSPEEFSSQERGLWDVLKKTKVKVFKWIKNIKNAPQKKIQELLDPIGDRHYELMFFDLQGEQDGHTGWQPLHGNSETQIFKDIAKDSKPVLLMLPGLFSKVQPGFDEFLDEQDYRRELAKKHCRYAIGFNMPTVVHGIKDNADEFSKLFKDKFDKKECNVLARSRGGVVARYLFEKNWNKDKTPFVLRQLIMFGTPNQGTMMASSKNWKTFFNYATNIARLSLGTVAPVVPTILTALKALSLRVVDLPGINDLEEQSLVLKELNDIKMDRSNYFVFTSDFEPDSRFFKRLVDEFIVDRMIFKRQTNDGVAPVLGAIFANRNISHRVQFDDKQYHIAPRRQEVSHFAYLQPRNKEIIAMVLRKL